MEDDNPFADCLPDQQTQDAFDALDRAIFAGERNEIIERIKDVSDLIRLSSITTKESLWTLLTQKTKEAAAKMRGGESGI